jgi:uncharacterized damage-inducible protein DinB
MAQYNHGMNRRLYQCAGRLAPAQIVADRGAFFGSILGTLNHLAVGDTLWLHRFARHRLGSPALEDLTLFPGPSSLRQVLAQDLASLDAHRQALDVLIDRWAGELSAEHMAATLSYQNMAGVLYHKNFGALVQHFFNHQTHHRGQVTALLLQAGVDPGVTDLLAWIPDEPA